MSDVDERLLYESLLAVYRDVNPEISERGAHLIRKLAVGLYARGARIEIGTALPPQHIFIHQSLSPLGKVLWTCRHWNEVMGYHSQAAVGRHISEFIAPSSYQMFQEFVWPELVRAGRVEQVPLILVRSTKEMLHAIYKTEIMRDSGGAFHRTFGKLKVTIPGGRALQATA